MDEQNFWAAPAEAHETAAEGTRLIAAEVAATIHGLWHRLGRALDAALSNAGHYRHLPPV